MTMLDPNTTITDGNARFILSVLSNQAGYTALFNLLADNWDAIRNRYFDLGISNLEFLYLHLKKKNSFSKYIPFF